MASCSYHSGSAMGKNGLKLLPTSHLFPSTHSCYNPALSGHADLPWWTPTAGHGQPLEVGRSWPQERRPFSFGWRLPTREGLVVSRTLTIPRGAFLQSGSDRRGVGVWLRPGAPGMGRESWREKETRQGAPEAMEFPTYLSLSSP